MPKFNKDADFKPVAQGLALMEGVEVVFEDKSAEKGKDDRPKGLLVKVKCKVVEHVAHPDSNDGHVQESFPLWTDFGFARFGGLMLAMFPQKFDANKDYPLNFFNDKKIQTWISKSFGGMQFGAMIKHDKQLKQGLEKASSESDYMIFSKMPTVYDKEEFKEVRAAQGGAPASDAPAGDSGADAGATAGGDDDWG